ncbi:ABC transporter [Actinotignum sanguinis]|uniref:ABC transporter ATP-binding protein n=1 Tax=Actinotignum sanguinis TaxID=1445614 RepID=UPI000F7E4290|nr:ABC transporter [Actinotignum sanguinis]
MMSRQHRSMTTLPIETKDLSKIYRGQSVLHNLTLSFPPGQIVGLAGHNGCGKSTLIRLLVGLEPPTHGQALIFGHPYRQLDYPLRYVGTLLGGSGATRSRTVRQHLAWIAATHHFASQRIDEVLHTVGLDHVATRKAGKLSLGMNQRLGLAAALLGDPPVLLLDEPSNGLDPQGIELLAQLIAMWRREGKTVVLSSHLLDFLADTCDRLVVLEQGSVAYDGAATLAHGNLPSGRWPSHPNTTEKATGAANHEGDTDA